MANVLYDKLGSPPEPGSLQEAICAIIYNARTEAKAIELFLTTIGRNISPFEQSEWLMRYMKRIYPYMKTEDEETETKRVTPAEFLDKITNEGPWVIFKEASAEESIIRANQSLKGRRGEIKI